MPQKLTKFRNCNKTTLKEILAKGNQSYLVGRLSNTPEYREELHACFVTSDCNNTHYVYTGRTKSWDYK